MIERQQLFIGPEPALGGGEGDVGGDGEGEDVQEWLMVRRAPNAEWERFYDPIEGFVHQAGTSYELVVEVSDVDDPPADGSSLRYRLIEIVSST